MTDASEPAVESYSVMVRRLTDALAEFVDAHSGLQAHAGIGRPYLDLSGLRRSLTEAHEAALIANARFGGRFGAAHIDQLGVQRVLMGWFGSEDFARYARFILQPVIDADTDHELLRTLEVYLDASLLHHRGGPGVGPAPQHSDQPDASHLRPAGGRA